MAALQPNLGLLKKPSATTSKAATPRGAYTDSLASLNLGSIGKPGTTGVTNRSVIPASVGGTAIASSSPAATAPAPTKITTPGSSSALSTPAAQQYVDTQLEDRNSQLESIKTQALNLKSQIPADQPKREAPSVPRPEKPQKTAYQSALDSYLESFQGSNRANERVNKASIDARRGYLDTLDTPGGTKQGAQESASLFNRNASSNLADLGVAQDSATNAANVALERLKYEQGLLPDSDPFTLSAGQSRYDAQGNIIASGGPDTPSTPASIQEYNFAKTQGYTGTFDEFKNSGGANNQNAILSPSEAQALGVPYGTTRGAASSMGITPTKPLTETQARDLTYGNRGQEASAIIDSLANDVVNFDALKYAGYKFLEPNSVGNALVPDLIRQYRQAQRNFLTAILRRESGASISPSEFSTGELQYFPRPGDDAQTLANKKQLRDTAISSFLQNAGQSGVQGGVSGSGLFDW